MRRGWVRFLALGLAALSCLLGTSERRQAAFAGQLFFAQSWPADDADDPDFDPAAACDLRDAVPTATITLGDAAVTPACAVVSAGDLLTWVNPTATEIVIHTADDQLTSED